MNIDRFRALAAVNNGFQFTTRYVVEIAIPERLQEFITNTTFTSEFSENNDYYLRSDEMLQLMCSGVASPSITFNTAEVKRLGYGPSTTYPLDLKYSDINLTFLVDSAGRIQNIFHKWIALMMENSDGTDTSYFFEYKSAYTTQLKIKLLDNSNNKNFIYVMEDAYPVSIGESALMWDQSEVLRLPVMFKFKKYYAVKAVEGLDNAVT